MIVGRRERKKSKQRQLVLEAAGHLIRTQGFWATTVEQIAAAADVSPATFFNYFPTKAAMLKAMAGDTLEELNAALRAQTDRPGPTAQRLDAFFAEAAAIVERARQAMGRVLLMVVRAAAHTSTGHDHLGQLRGAFSALFYSGQERGDLRTDIDATFLAELATASFVATLTSWLNDPRYPLTIRTQQTAAFLAAAIRKPGGTARRPHAVLPARRAAMRATSQGGTHVRRNDDD